MTVQLPPDSTGKVLDTLTVSAKERQVAVLGDPTTAANVAAVTAAGALKVDGSAVTQPVSGTVTANIGTPGSLALDATLTGGTAKTRIFDGANTATVKAASTAAATADTALVVALHPSTMTPAVADGVATGSLTAQNANGTSGAATAGSAVVVAALNGAGSVIAQCTANSAFTGSIRFEASLDGGTTWTAVSLVDHSGTQNATFGSSTSTVALGSLYLSATVPGATNFRLVCTAFTSGSSTWTLRAAVGIVAQTKISQGGSNQIGTIRVSDGTNTSAVKAASTAPVAADPALVVAISPNGSATVAEKTSAGAALSNTADSATSVTVLASNASRRGACFYNDSTAIAYLKLGATASTTSFTVKLQPGDYYELPQPTYTGGVDCIWASAPGGAIRVTELT